MARRLLTRRASPSNIGDDFSDGLIEFRRIVMSE